MDEICLLLRELLDQLSIGLIDSCVAVILVHHWTACKIKWFYFNIWYFMKNGIFLISKTTKKCRNSKNINFKILITAWPTMFYRKLLIICFQIFLRFFFICILFYFINIFTFTVGPNRFEYLAEISYNKDITKASLPPPLLP